MANLQTISRGVQTYEKDMFTHNETEELRAELQASEMQHLAAEERCMAAERELAECKARYATLQKDNDRLEEERRHILSTVLDMTGSRMEELSKNLSFTSHSAESKKRKVDEIGSPTGYAIGPPKKKREPLFHTGPATNGSRSAPPPVGPSFEDKGISHAARCIRCYRHDLPCDKGEPCKCCVQAGLGPHCKRAKCRYFKAGTCKIRGCSRAHEDDLTQYKQVKWAGHVSKSKYCGQGNAHPKTRPGNSGSKGGGGSRVPLSGK